jgi:hypothetical protein
MVSVLKCPKVLPLQSIDVGINFLAVAYNSKDETTFYQGRSIKDKRAQYKRIRKSLQQKQTPSVRKRLKEIGRWRVVDKMHG